MSSQQNSSLCPECQIKDNDPRQHGRVLTIERLDDRFAYAKSRSGTVSRIQVSRIYTDGLPRRTGYSLVHVAPPRAGLVELQVRTYHPHDYVLFNEADGTFWRGTINGSWRSEASSDAGSLQAWVDETLAMAQRFSREDYPQWTQASRAQFAQQLRRQPRLPAARSDDAALLQQALDALEAQTSDAWEGMNSHHPKVWAAINALKARLPAGAQYDGSATEAGARAQADAHLRALLRFTESFYGSAIQHGMKASETANAVAHIERSAKSLHALVHAWADTAQARSDAAKGFQDVAS